MPKRLTAEDIPPGTRIQFNGSPRPWLVRAVSADGRYSLATTWFGFGGVAYTIIDHEQGFRGPLNVIGGGMGINTTAGPDPQIDETMMMLRPYPDDYMEGYPDGRPEDPDDIYGFEVSHRNNVPTNITAYKPADQELGWINP